MSTASALTLHLAILIGLYETAVGLGGLGGALRWTALIDEIERSPALTLLAGAIAFVIGGALVLAHNFWTDPLAIVVTLIGWVALAEGVIFLAVPGPFLALFRGIARYQRAISIAALLFGILILAAGLTGRATASF
jgi:hypothetical protein